ncbi:MAG TPA: type II toxin-antitoxin system prevent-host-death family antitoxin [Acidimicrobiales bacterium]|nr:type II toxin-antitoxin system prevent-host-death family antitoxin [Acidimicrobiales bacterium]
MMSDSFSVHHVGTRDLRANLAHYLRAAEAGHTIFVTVDGKVVAQLGPVGNVAENPSVEALIASGLVEAPSNSNRQGPEVIFDLPAGLSSERALREIRGR